MKPVFTIAVAAAALLGSAGSAVAGTPEDIIAAQKCSKCHTATTTKKGPSWASLAQKYKGDPAAEARLVAMLKTGGKTSDGDDHKKIEASDADLKAIVAIVLSSK
ncbi:MAG: c-type cytochrome [Ideonella sp.]